MAYLTRHRFFLLGIMSCGFFLAVLAHGGPLAFALSQRGHELQFPFGSSGEPGASLSEPGAVAVSAFTGDVYVLDRGHGRIVRFAPMVDGAGRTTGYVFVSAWGWGVNQGGKKVYEVCTADCRAGLAGAKAYQFNRNVLGVAVDNCAARNAAGEPEWEADGRLKPCAGDPSAGDVYVAGEHYDAQEEEDYEGVDKFTADGEPVERVERLRWEEKSASGLHACEEKHGGAGCVAEELEPEEAHGFTVGPEGAPWLYYEEELYPLSDVKLSEAGGERVPLRVSLGLGEPGFGLAKDAQGRFYIGQEVVDARGGVENAISRWEAIDSEAGAEALQEAARGPGSLDARNAAAVAVNPLDVSGNGVDEAGDVYLAEPTSEGDAGGGASQSTVGQFGPEGELLQRFGAAGLKQAAGVAVDPADGMVFVSDAQAGVVDVFGLAPPGAPAVDDVSVRDVSGESAQLLARIDPGGRETEYTLEYGTVPCGGSSSECARVKGVLPAGYGDRIVAVQLRAGTSAPVAPGLTYHYRLVASNAGGETVGGEGAFSTPAASGAPTADGRGWEMVSPPDKGGADVMAVPSEGGGLVQAAADGGAIGYLATGPFAEPEGNRSLEPSQILSLRTPNGWSSKDITTPDGAGMGLTLGTEKEYEFFSEDLSLALLTPFRSFNSRFAGPPLAPAVSAGERELMLEEQRNHEKLAYQENTIYLRDDHGVQPQAEAERAPYERAQANGENMGNPGYLALIDGDDAPGARFGDAGALAFLDATPDLAHVVVEAVPLVAGEVAEGLYEWSAQPPEGAGTLGPVNILPGDEGGGAVAGALGRGGRVRSEEAMTFRHAISADGSRVVWTAPGKGLFMRDTVRGETIRIAPAGAMFQTASADGSRVFFTDTKPLTPKSGREGQADLYVCEVNEDAGTHRLEECTLGNGRLVDLTPTFENAGHELESADVQGLAIGASEDGSRIYFVAAGSLSESAPRSVFCDQTSEISVSEGGQPQKLRVPSYPGETCDLYVVTHESDGGWGSPRFIRELSTEDEHDWNSWFTHNQEEEGQSQGELTSRVSPDGRYLAFMSDLPLTGYDNRASNPAARDTPTEEVYLYDANTGGLVCASCDPTGRRPVGMRVPLGLGRVLVDENESWQNRWLAASLPEAPSIIGRGTDALYQSRYLSNSGRLYFNTPETLAPGDSNRQEDVYEYEPVGVPQGRHACTTTTLTYNPQAGGCVGLISSGTATSESLFLDASETGGEGPRGEQLSEGGGDVFFLSAAKLVPEDIEDTYAAYDAHECTGASPCIVPPQEKPPAACETSDACRPHIAPAQQSTSTPPSATANPTGNITPKRSVSPSKTIKKARPLTRPRKLAIALKACRSRYKHRTRQRVACEHQARKRYGQPSKNTREASRGRHPGRESAAREGGRR